MRRSLPVLGFAILLLSQPVRAGGGRLQELPRSLQIGIKGAHAHRRGGLLVIQRATPEPTFLAAVTTDHDRRRTLWTTEYMRDLDFKPGHLDLGDTQLHFGKVAHRGQPGRSSIHLRLIKDAQEVVAHLDDQVASEVFALTVGRRIAVPKGIDWRQALIDQADDPRNPSLLRPSDLVVWSTMSADLFDPDLQVNAVEYLLALPEFTPAQVGDFQFELISADEIRP